MPLRTRATNQLDRNLLFLGRTLINNGHEYLTPSFEAVLEPIEEVPEPLNIEDSSGSGSPSLSVVDSEESNMGDEARTLRELTAPDLSQQPLCITFPPLTEGVNFELKSGIIHLLPSFHGIKGEDANKHLSEFHVTCSAMKPRGVTEEQIKLRAFPFSLKDAAKDWLYYLPPNSITTWPKMKEAFLNKYFPPTQSALLKREISNAQQDDGESLYEFWERFKRLCASCPYHGYQDHDLILYFTNGLFEEDARMLNAASGGGILNLTIEQANTLIDQLASSSRHMRQKNPNIRRGVQLLKSSEETSNASQAMLIKQMANLTTLVQDHLLDKARQKAQVCSLCESYEHGVDECSFNVVEGNESVKAIGTYGNAPRPRYDSYPNNRDHPNFRWRNQDEPQKYQSKPTSQNYQQPNNNQNYQQKQPFSNNQAQNTPQASMSAEELVKSLALTVGTLSSNVNTLTNTVAQQQTSLTNVETQIGQMASAINRLEAQGSNKIPSQTVPNPNCSAVSLRNGRELQEVEKGQI